MIEKRPSFFAKDLNFLLKSVYLLSQARFQVCSFVFMNNIAFSNLSSIAETFGSAVLAAFLSVVSRKAFTALRVVLC
jgi:hypothetical protein